MAFSVPCSLRMEGAPLLAPGTNTVPHATPWVCLLGKHWAAHKP